MIKIPRAYGDETNQVRVDSDGSLIISLCDCCTEHPSLKDLEGAFPGLNITITND